MTMKQILNKLKEAYELREPNGKTAIDNSDLREVIKVLEGVIMDCDKEELKATKNRQAKPTLEMKLKKLIKTYETKAKFGVETYMPVYADVAGELRNILKGD